MTRGLRICIARVILIPPHPFFTLSHAFSHFLTLSHAFLHVFLHVFLHAFLHVFLHAFFTLFLTPLFTLLSRRCALQTLSRAIAVRLRLSNFHSCPRLHASSPL